MNGMNENEHVPENALNHLESVLLMPKIPIIWREIRNWKSYKNNILSAVSAVEIIESRASDTASVSYLFVYKIKKLPTL